MAGRNDLAISALGKLGAIDVGQPPSAEDMAKVLSAIDPMLDDLGRGRDVHYVQDPDNLTGIEMRWLPILLADSVSDDFLKTIDPMKVALAEQRLRESRMQVRGDEVKISGF